MKLPSPRFALPALLLTGLLISGGLACGSGGGSNNAPPTGMTMGPVEVLASPCPSGPGSFAGTTCTLLSVSITGLPSVQVELRVIEPPAPTTVTGTVVLGTGGLGNVFYSDTTGGPELITDLLAAGLRVAERRWTTSWLDMDGDFKADSERYARLLEWIHVNVYTVGGFSAMGNSAGSAEIAYSLTTWGMEALLDRAVMTGGPPFARVDFNCDVPATQVWLDDCAAIIPPGVFVCGMPSCVGEMSGLCGLLPASPAPGELEEASILHPLAVLGFPTTELTILLGTNDCTSAVPQGLLFYDSLMTTEDMQFVPNTPHLVSSSTEGRAAILAAVTGVAPAPASALLYQARFSSTTDANGDVTQTLFGEVYEPGAQNPLRQFFLFESGAE